MSGQASTAKTARIEFRVTETEKAQWVKQAGSRRLSDYLRFLVQQDTDTPDAPPAPVAVNGFSSSTNDLSAYGGSFFKATPAPKGRR